MLGKKLRVSLLLNKSAEQICVLMRVLLPVKFVHRGRAEQGQEPHAEQANPEYQPHKKSTSGFMAFVGGRLW